MLDGIRVIDLTRLLPGPYATWLLAGMGAEVIKVEEPGRGDYIRANWPRRGGTSTVFHVFNRGKRLVAANLKHPDGQALLWDLIDSADVLIEGFRPGVMRRLGFGWEQVHERRPQLVYTSLSGFGQDSPYVHRVAHDINYLSIAGLQDGLRDTTGHPVPARFQIADMAGGALSAVVGTLSALIGARADSTGRYVDVAMTDAVFPFQGLRLAEELIPGDPAPDDWAADQGHDKELGAYRTSDGGYVTLDPYELKFKNRLWEVLGREGFGDPPSPTATRTEVRERLGQIIGSRSRDEWVELLGDKEVCFSPVYEPHELADDPHITHRGLLGDVLDPGVASPSLGFPIVFDPPLDPVASRDVTIGAETREVLKDLGWDDDQIDDAEHAGGIARG